MTATENAPPVALVTGASRGIGRAAAVTLAEAGYRVILTARSIDALAATVDQLQATGLDATALTCDLADRSAIDRLLDTVHDTHGRLDVLVNNAGVLPPARRAEQVSYAEWDLALQINLTAPWALATRAKPLMRRGSTVLNVASTASYYPSTGLLAYDVSKAAVLMLTRVLALEWARDGIRVVGIAPGKVDTELLAPIKALAESGTIPLNPQRRIAAADEVAALIAFLVSPAASYITGTTVPIDGGELLVATSEIPR